MWVVVTVIVRLYRVGVELQLSKGKVRLRLGLYKRLEQIG